MTLRAALARLLGVFTLLLAVGSGLAAQGAWAQTDSHPDFPPLTGRVVDAAHLLSPADIGALTGKLAALEAQSQRQVVVVTIPDLHDVPIEDYGYQLGRAWGIGDKQRNDGILLLVAPHERKVRIEVGYGLEGIITDTWSFVVINQLVQPRFRQGDYAGGISAAVDQIANQLRLPPDEARKVAKDAQAKADRAREPHFDGATLVFFGIFLLIFIVPWFRRSHAGTGFSGSGGGGWGFWPGVFLLEMMGSGDRWGGGGGWGNDRDNDNGGAGGWGGGGIDGGGGGGDDFSGGGGSFGGGGASGSW